jgi:hypothetical protein
METIFLKGISYLVSVLMDPDPANRSVARSPLRSSAEASQLSNVSVNFDTDYTHGGAPPVCASIVQPLGVAKITQRKNKRRPVQRKMPQSPEAAGASRKRTLGGGAGIEGSAQPESNRNAAGLMALSAFRSLGEKPPAPRTCGAGAGIRVTPLGEKNGDPDTTVVRLRGQNLASADRFDGISWQLRGGPPQSTKVPRKASGSGCCWFSRPGLGGAP